MSKEVTITIDIDEEAIAHHVEERVIQEIMKIVNDTLNKEQYGSYRDTTYIRQEAKKACKEEAMTIFASREDELFDAIVNRVSGSIIRRKKLQTALELLEDE